MATERHALKTLDRERLGARYDELSAQAVAQLDADGVPTTGGSCGASPTAATPDRATRCASTFPPGRSTTAWVEELEEAFHRAHEAEYGHRFDAEIEIINIRVVGIGRIDELEPASAETGDGDPAGARTLEREVVFDVDGARAPARRRSTTASCCGRRPDRGPGDRRAVRLDDGRSARPRRPRSTASATSSIDCTNAFAAAAERDTELATPILMRVIGGAFSAIAKEMAGVLFRMSYSSIIRESEDLGAGIFDAEGNDLAESDSTPMFMGAMPKIVKGVIKLLGDDIHEGDVILHNDPYLGATHSPDVAIVIPIFFDGDSSASPAPRRTCSTSAAPIPGLAIDLVDNWSEGNIYRAVKLSEKGVRQDALWKHILENTRTPTHNRGDIEAMIAACELARRRYLELLGRYGLDGGARRGPRLDRTTPSGCCARRSPRCPTGDTRPTSAGWTTTARTAACSCRSRWRSRSRATRSRSTSPARATRCRRASTARSKGRPSRR